MSPEAKGQTIGKDAKDMQELKLTVSSSPHVRCNETVPKIMWSVVAALVPAAAFGVYYFGVNALVNICLLYTSPCGYFVLQVTTVTSRISPKLRS